MRGVSAFATIALIAKNKFDIITKIIGMRGCCHQWKDLGLVHMTAAYTHLKMILRA